jgi:Leucine Rich repeat
LSFLNLNENVIGDTGAIALAEAIEVNTSLTHLLLSKNLLKRRGVIALSMALEVNTCLIRLDFDVSDKYFSLPDLKKTVFDSIKYNPTLTEVGIYSIKERGGSTSLGFRPKNLTMNESYNECYP